LKNLLPLSENGAVLDQGKIRQLLAPLLRYIRSGTAMKSVVIHSDQEAAFRSSYSLKSLRVYTEDDDIAAIVLNGLKNGYRLRELKLRCGESYGLPCWTALSEFVHATTHVKHVQLEGLLFERSLVSPERTILVMPASSVSWPGLFKEALGDICVLQR
jgi:hypothetical protein